MELMDSKHNESTRSFIKKVVVIMIASIIVVGVALCMIKSEETKAAIDTIVSTISPIIYGLVLAYLVNFLYIRVLRIEQKIFKQKKYGDKADRIMRYIAIVISEIIFIAFIAVAVVSIIPSLIDNATVIVKGLPETLGKTRDYILELINNNGMLRDTVGQHLDLIQDKVTNFISNNLESNTEYFMTKAFTIVGGTFKYTINAFMSVVLSIMVLANKDTMLKNTKKAILALFGEKWSTYIFNELSVVNTKFSGFFVGKIVDSIIIGVLAFIGTSLLGINYAALIAFIIGITNIIPIVGPFIGAIPCAVIVLGQSPKLTIYFLIFILILQQIDGNIIGPKCIGNSTNINSFWVLVSLIIFGELFGFTGMIIGVPIMAVIHDIVNKLINRRFNKVTISSKNEDTIKDDEHSIDSTKG
jgi:predicted PurR-regulated permease PerM